MIINNEAEIDLLTVSSMGVRIIPAERQPVHISSVYKMYSTSAETNVLSAGAALGLKTKVLTKFVKDSPIALFIQAELRKLRIDYEGLEVEQGGPWGFRHQFNIADSGYGVRGPRVHNDRAGEIGRTIRAEDFDLERIFRKEGVKVVHLSGLIAAMSEDTADCCLKIARTAKENGSILSFDLNYRATFWEGRKEELYQVFSEIAKLADILIGNEEDFQLALGIEGPDSAEKGDDLKTDAFREMIGRVSEVYPNASVYATTLRDVRSANLHNWGAILRANGEWYVEEPREIAVLDRIGGGDSFVGGLLYGIIKGWPPEKYLQFAWATGALATTVLTDYITPVNEKQVWDIYKGNARVVR